MIEIWPSQNRNFLSKFFTLQEKTKRRPTRLPKTESIYSSRTLQDGSSTGTLKNNRTGRLHMQNQSQGCLRSSSNAPRFNGLLNLRKPRNSLQVPLSSIWFKRFTKNLQQNNALCDRTIKKRRYKNHSLSRRHLYIGKNKSRNEQKTNYKGKKPLRSIRFYHKLYEEYINTFKDSRIFRLYF